MFPAADINEELDRLESTAPAAGLDASFAAPQLLHSVDRLLRLVSEGRLPVGHVKSFTSRFVLKLEEVERLVGFLMDRRFKEDAEAARIALDVAQNWIWQTKHNKQVASQGVPKELAQTLFGLLESCVSKKETDAHAWVEVLGAVHVYSPERALKLAAEALVADSHFLPEQIQPLLGTWAKDALGRKRANDFVELLSKR